MGIKVSNLDEVGDIFMTTFGDYRQALLIDLFENLMETTPEATGTLKHNWRFNPYGKAGDYLRINTGDPQPFPRSPDEVTYDRNWKQFTIYNNSPYIVHVNDGESGNEHNQNFIQQALAMTDSKF